MTRADISVIMEAIMDFRSEIREDMKDMSERLSKIDDRLREVELVQAVSREIEVKTDLSGKWKAGIATSVAAAVAALLQALTQSGK